MYFGISSVSYTKRVEILKNSLSKADQVKFNESQRFTLFYTFLKNKKITIVNKALALIYILKPQCECVEKMEANRC